MGAILILLTITSNLLAEDTLITDNSSALIFSEKPRNLQFFARDNYDSSEVKYSGILYLPGYDSVFVEVYRNNTLWKRNSHALNYEQGEASFYLNPKIHSELSEFKFKLYFKAGSSSALAAIADSVVCGDAYIIAGQSNSQPTDYLATYTNEYCRSFGVQTATYNSANYNPADTNWGLSKADGAVIYWAGPYNVGVWGLYLQKQIVENTGIPTCIINGGRGSSTIEMNLRNNFNQTDLTTTYGRLLYRVLKAGLADKIKGIFWYQGESNGGATWVNYRNNFRILYNSWKENYPNFKRIFAFQLRPCCSEQYASQLREVQRNLPNEYNDVEIFSTAGIPGYQGCHYSFNGYLEIAKMIYKPFAKIFYSVSDTVNIYPPEIRAAYYTSPEKNEIALLFNRSKISRWPSDTLGESMKNYFYLNGYTGYILSGNVSGDTVKLKLIAPLNATRITYLPTVWTHIDSVVYEGPFMKNGRGIGALSFHDFPISDYSPVQLSLKAAVDGYYNPVTTRLNLKDTLRVYLRTNQYPFSIVDSAKAEIDSVSLTGKFSFYNTPPGTYYIVVKGRNSLETWSADGGEYLSPGATIEYDFTKKISKAYGNNLIQRGSKFCIYSADVNQDGVVDLDDNLNTLNDANMFMLGYVNTDLNGDYVVDLEDLSISFYSISFIVEVARPY
ncbi:MAG TPA: sialate O-acetylesterase [Ignavibacteria bacterium]|nr:sialate O-acetylesterase [Ignavibacteria bacterium]HMR41303.1 sialate O-acetylesterase [Ignavibacteria bacterium]